MARTLEKIKWYKKMYGTVKTCRYLKNKILYGYMDDYPRWQKKHAITEAELQAQRETHFDYEPLISIVVPLYKTPTQYLDALVQSVRAQTYGNWELCLSDGSGKSESDNDAGGAVQTPLRALLGHLQAADARIRVVTSDTQLGISDNTNKALEIAKGECIAFADHDDLLAPNALYENVKMINEYPEVQFIYSDEDKVDGKGKRFFMPHFKPDFNLELLRSTNYFCHLCVVKRELFEKACPLNGEYDGAQDYDFVLRCVEQVGDQTQIRHIPKILYHWRAYAESTAESADRKDYANDAGMRVLKAHYERIGVKADVEPVEKGGIVYPGMYRTRYQVEGKPTVAVVKGQQHLKEISDDYILFLSEDAQPVTKDFIQEMLSYCAQSEVGAVGAKVYGPDECMIYAGGFLCEDGSMRNAFEGFMHDDPGYFGRAILAQDVHGVSDACVMVKREVLGQDVDQSTVKEICEKIKRDGKRMVFVPFAEVTCSCDSNKDNKQIKQSSSSISDPYYNKNLNCREASYDLNI